MAVHHARGEQRRMEPAAMLVGAFEVQVRRISSISSLVRAAQHGEVRRARIEPDVERVARLSRTARRPRRAALPALTPCHASMPPFSTRCATSSSSSGVRGCSAPVSLCRKNGIGTPHCRWRDSVQSGRLAIMPCRRAWPQAGKNSVASMPRSAVCAQALACRRPCPSTRTTAWSRAGSPASCGASSACSCACRFRLMEQRAALFQLRDDLRRSRPRSTARRTAAATARTCRRPSPA